MRVATVAMLAATIGGGCGGKSASPPKIEKYDAPIAWATGAPGVVLQYDADRLCFGLQCRGFKSPTAVAITAAIGEVNGPQEGVLALGKLYFLQQAAGSHFVSTAPATGGVATRLTDLPGLASTIGVVGGALYVGGSALRRHSTGSWTELRSEPCELLAAADEGLVVASGGSLAFAGLDGKTIQVLGPINLVNDRVLDFRGGVALVWLKKAVMVAELAGGRTNTYAMPELASAESFVGAIDGTRIYFSIVHGNFLADIGKTELIACSMSLECSEVAHFDKPLGTNGIAFEPSAIYWKVDETIYRIPRRLE